MKTLSQKGVAHLSVVLIVLVVAAIAGVGWTVSQKDKEATISSFEECVAAGNPVMESYPEQCSADGQTFVKSVTGFKVDEDKLPEGYQIVNNTETVVTLDNSAIDTPEGESCFAEVMKVTDERAKDSDQAKLTQKLYAEASDQMQENKGYKSEKLDDSEMLINTKAGTSPISAVIQKFTGPDKSSVNYATTAFIIHDGYYLSIRLSCERADFATAQKALLAVTFE